MDGRDGLSPTGLLVRTAGRVTHTGQGFVYLDDGSGLRDETEWTGIRVVLADTGRILQGDDVCITGIAGLRRDTLRRVWPVVRVEPADQAANDDDLVVLCPAGGSLTLTATPYAVAPGGSAQVTAEVRDRDGNPWNNVVVDFSTTLGVIAAPHGFVTDENGQVVVTLSEVAEGAFAIVTATAMPCRELLSNRLQVDFLQSLPDGWPMFQHDERRQGFSRFNDTDTVIEDALELVWSGQVPTATLSAAPLETLPIHDSSPVHAAGCPVIVGAFQGSQGDLTAATGYVVAFEPNPPNPGPNMPPVWRYPAGSAVIGGVASTPAIFQSGAEKRVVFGSTDGKVYCLNAVTGRLIWVFQTLGRTNQPAPVVASPVVYEGMVYLGNVEGRLYCLDGSSTDPGGQMVWSFDLEPYSPGLMSVTPMTIGFAGPEARLYVGCENHRLYCLSTAVNPANRMIWSFTANQAVFAAPSFYAGNVYFGCATSTTENLYCLNAESGFVMWTRRSNDEIRATPACAGGSMSVGDDTGQILYRRHFASGDAQAEFDAFDHRPYLAGMADWFLSSVALTSAGVMFVGNDNYAFYPLRSLDLGHLTSVGTGGEVRSSPAVSYACQPGYRWIFVTTKAYGGLLLAFRQPIDVGEE